MRKFIAKFSRQPRAATTTRIPSAKVHSFNETQAKIKRLREDMKDAREALARGDLDFTDFAQQE